MNSINFSYNWNNKLNCNFFSTVRKPNSIYVAGETFFINMEIPKKLQVGNVTHETVFTAELLHIKTKPLSLFLPSDAYFDTGYTLQEFINIICKIYKIDFKNWQDFELSILYFKRTNPIKAQPVIKTVQ